MHSSVARVLKFGAFEVDLHTRELRRQGMQIKLQEQPFQILESLLEHPAEIVTREQLRQKLWPADTFIDVDNSVNAAINRLREALGDSAESPRFVETVPRRGYRFIAPVTEIKAGEGGEVPNDASLGALARPQDVRRDENEPGSRKVALSLTLVAVVILAAASIWAWKRWRAAGSVPIQSLAVLPLANLSGDPSQDYFADEMTDELITSLAKINSLRVVSRTSAMHYKNLQKPLPEIARELNVDAIVEGTVTRSRDRIRITVQLIDARTDRHLWAEDYDRPVGDAVTLQNQIARAVAGEIRAKLTPEERVQLSLERPVNPVAYEAYLKGRFHWNKRTESDLKAGIDYFNRSIEADPQYALAYVGLADSYNILGSWALTALPAGEARKMALLYANKALAIDDRLGEAHASLANAKVLFNWDWEGGEAEFKRAIELSPNYANAYHWYAELLLNLARYDECISKSYKAKELDPLSPVITFGLARRLAYAGRAEPAIKEAAIALELDPNLPLTHAALGDAYVQQRRIPEAIAEFEKAVRFSNSNPNFIADMGYAYAVAGERAHAGEILNRLKEMSRARYVPPYQLAAVYAGLGENRKALQELEKAYIERSPWMINLRVDPHFQHLRAEPEFVRLLKALQFPDT